MFTPVSSQAQAFVPAHAAYPHLRNQAQGRGRGYPGDGVVLYGAHGQPLPPQQQAVPESTLPPPQGAYYPPGYGRPPHMDDRIAPPPMPHHMPHDQVGSGNITLRFPFQFSHSISTPRHQTNMHLSAPTGRPTRFRCRI
jgi:hypothetical protein